MGILVDVLLRILLGWMEEHPDSKFSKFMTADRGPGTDVGSMNRLGRLRSGLIFLCWAVVSFSIVMVLAYVVWELKILPPEHPVFLGIFFVLTCWTLICLVAGLYLLLRIII